MKESKKPSRMMRLMSKKPVVSILLFILAFVFFGNSISNEYAMDDVVVITENSYTQKGFEGLDEIFTEDSFAGYLGHNRRVVQGGRYRPLSIATFAIAYEFFGQNPQISHFINVVLYGITGILIFLIFTMQPVYERMHSWNDHTLTFHWKFMLPFVITLIYIMHPLHTEAVANIKGRDELFAMLFSLLTLYFSLRYAQKEHWKWLLISFASFFLGLLSKENTITFLAVVPLSMWVFTQTSIRTKIKAIAPLLAATLLFLYVRVQISGLPGGPPPNNLMNNPFAEATFAERYATVFYTLFLYIKQLFIPHPLTVDYYPYHIPLISWGDIRAILPLLLYLAMFAFAVVRIRKKSIAAFSILYYLFTISIVSNFFFIIGTFMSERFLFMPSLGFAVFIGYFLFIVIPMQSPVKKYNLPLFLSMTGLLAAILVFFGTKTIIRNEQWKNDYTLFSHDVKVSANSAFGNKSLGNHLIKKALENKSPNEKKRYLSKALNVLHKSLKIYPDYQKALFLTANAEYLYAKDFKENHNNYERAFHYYGKLLNFDPDHDEAYKNIAVILQNIEDTDYKLKIWKDLHKLNPGRFEVNYHLGAIYRDAKQNPAKAVGYFKAAIKARPDNASLYMDLGVAYANIGNWDKAREYHEIAIKKGLVNAKVYRNLQIIHQQLGNKEQAQKYQQKAKNMTAKN